MLDARRARRLQREKLADELVRRLDLVGHAVRRRQQLHVRRTDAGHLLEVAGDLLAEPVGELVLVDLGFFRGVALRQRHGGKVGARRCGARTGIQTLSLAGLSKNRPRLLRQFRPRLAFGPSAR